MASAKISRLVGNFVIYGYEGHAVTVYDQLSERQRSICLLKSVWMNQALG